MKRTMFMALTAAMLSTQASSAETVNIVFNSFIPSQHYFNQEILFPWLEEVEELTEGRVHFDVPTSSLAAPNQQYSSIKNGVFDAGYIVNSSNPELIKLMNVAQLPLINDGAQQSSVALWRTYQEYFAKTSELSDVKVLTTFVANPVGIYGLKGEVNKPQDIQGKRAYAAPGASAIVMDGLGAGVLAQPAVRSYEVVSSGAVDVMTGYALSDTVTFKTMQFLESVTEIPGNITAPGFTMIMNKDIWNKISEKDQAIIEQHAGEVFANRFALYDQKASDAKEKALSEGINFIPASSELMDQLKTVAADMSQAWIDTANSMGVDGKAALEFYKTHSLSKVQ